MDDTEVRITLRLPGSLRDRLSEAADNNSRSMNGEIVARLEHSFNANSDQQAWEAYVKYLRADQEHIENEYLAGKTDSLLPEASVAKPKKLPPLLREITDLVNRRTQLAMEVIVKELERKGMLFTDGVPTADEWAEIRAAPRELQAEILDALAKLDVKRALEIARSDNKRPSEFSFDDFFAEWVQPILQESNIERRNAMLDNANAILSEHYPSLAILVRIRDGVPEVLVGIRNPAQASREALGEADQFLSSRKKHG